MSTSFQRRRISHRDRPQIGSDFVRTAVLVRSDPKPVNESQSLGSNEAAFEGNVPWSYKVVLVVLLVAPFAGCALAIAHLWQFGWAGWLYINLAIAGWLLTGLGITVGFHRLLTHRSFDTYPWIRAIWTALGALAIEGTPLVWCAIHRKHHQHSDHSGDPHSPHVGSGSWWALVRGFLHAHFGWFFYTDVTDRALRQYVPDLVADRFVHFVHRSYVYWIGLTLLIPAAIGGLVTLSWTGALLGLIWGGGVRLFFTHHITWSINSVCHIFGSRDFKVKDQSRNNVLFGILAHGEGWHNNHHAFPTSARHGLKSWQFDLSWVVIRGLEWCGLAWNVQLPSKEALAERRIG